MGQLRNAGIAAVLLGLVIVGWIAFSRNQDAPHAVNDPSPSTPGWEDLGACTETHSLDGQWTLELLSDGRATTSGSVASEMARGNWTFDEGAKLYRVTFPGLSAAYTLVMAEGVSCMLIAGDLAAANLRASWFAATSHQTMDDEVQDDRPYPER